MSNFLDQAGLSYLWTKILSAIESHSVTLPDKLVSYKAAMTITATEKLNADTLGGYSATYFAKGADVSIIQETIRTQASEILKAQQAVSSMESTVSSLVKNKANSVHAAQHAKDGSDPITLASIGAAPGGFGLGAENGQTLSSADDLDTITKNGMYQWGSSRPKNAPIEYCKMRVWNGAGWASQEVMSAYANEKDSIRRRVFGNNVWGPWEWVNPPMQVGVEYRTTERYLRKPVYAKTVNMGDLPNNAIKLGSFQSVEIVDKIVSVAAQCDSGDGHIIYLPHHAGSAPNLNTVILVSATNRGYTQVATFTDVSMYTNLCMTVKYTKLAD